MATVGREKDRKRRIEKKKKRREEGREGLGTGEPDVAEKEHGPSRFALKEHRCSIKKSAVCRESREGWVVERR